MSAIRDKISDVLKGNLGILIISSGIWNIVGNLANPYFSIYVLALGGSYFDIGLTSAMGGIFALVSVLFAGPMTDNFGRKKLVVTLGYVLTSIYIIYFMAPGWQFLLIGQGLNSLIDGIRGPALSAIVADSTHPHDRALAYSLWQRIPQTVTIASPIVGGYIIDQIGIVPAMRWFYVATFFSSLTAQMLRHKFLKETLPEVGNRLQIGVISALQSTFELPSRIPRQLLNLILCNGALNFGMYLTESYWVIYATRDVVGLSAVQWGLANFSYTIVMVIFTIVFAFASDKYGRTKFIIISLILTPILIALFPFARSFTDVLFIWLALGFSDSLRAAPFSTLLVDYSPRNFRGRINSFMRLVSEPGRILGALFGGLMYQSFSKPSPFFLGAFVMALIGVVFFLFIKDAVKPEE